TGLSIFGSILADRLLGQRKAIIWGSTLMLIGHATLALPYNNTFFPGLSFVAWGSGFYSGSDTAIIGTLYRNNDNTKKDTGFTIWYTFLNIGSALGGGICGYVGQQINWHYGFGIAGIFMLF